VVVPGSDVERQAVSVVGIYEAIHWRVSDVARRFDFISVRAFPVAEGHEGQEEIHWTVHRRKELVKVYRPRTWFPESRVGEA